MVWLVARGETLERVGHFFGISSAGVQKAVNRQVRYFNMVVLMGAGSDGGGAGNSTGRTRKGAPNPDQEAREKRDREIFLASSRGISSEVLARLHGLTVQRIGQIVNKRIHQVRLEGWHDWLRVRTLRLAVLRRILPGWAGKAIAESQESNSQGKALQTLLRILHQEAKYVGIYELARLEKRWERPLQKAAEAEARVAKALELQLKLVLAALEDYPAAREAVLEALLQAD